MARKLRIEIHRDFRMFAGRFGMWMAKLAPNGEPTHVLDEYNGWQVITENEATSPVVVLDQDDVQDILDQLWAQGVRPSRGSAEGELAATKRHLEDMRGLVFKTGKP